MERQYFKCGCYLYDAYQSSNICTKPVFRQCKKHKKEMKKCSWEEWAKVYAPKKYESYLKDMDSNI